jgi:hypothetical protein
MTYHFLVLDRKDVTVNQKGKEAEIQKWEAEVRKTLASKKAGAPKLSKQEEVLLQVQLTKEIGIRTEVESLKRQLSEGLQVVHSLVDTRLEVFQQYISQIFSLLLACAMGRPAELLETDPFDAIIVSLLVKRVLLRAYLRSSKEIRKLLRRKIRIPNPLDRHRYTPCHQFDFCSGEPSGRDAGAYVHFTFPSFVLEANFDCRACVESALSMLHSCGEKPNKPLYILIHSSIAISSST